MYHFWTGYMNVSSFKALVSVSMVAELSVRSFWSQWAKMKVMFKENTVYRYVTYTYTCRYIIDISYTWKNPGDHYLQPSDEFIKKYNFSTSSQLEDKWHIKEVHVKCILQNYSPETCLNLYVHSWDSVFLVFSVSNPDTAS